MKPYITYLELLELIAKNKHPKAIIFGREGGFTHNYYWQSDEGEYHGGTSTISQEMARLGSRAMTAKRMIGLPDPQLTPSEATWLKAFLLPWKDNRIWITKRTSRGYPYLFIEVQQNDETEEVETPCFEEGYFDGLDDDLTTPVHKLLGWEEPAQETTE